MEKKKRIIALLLCCVAILGGLTQAFAQGNAVAYSDVKTSDGFCPVVTKASERGIISGYPDGSFKPAKEVTYGEFLAMSQALEVVVHEEKPVHWAKGYYDHAVKNGYIQATDFSVSDLGKPIPRSDMALIMAGLIKARGLEIPQNSLVFSDVSTDAPCSAFIDLCTRAGVLTGYPDGSFRPSGYLKRSEAAAAIMNYIRLIDESLVFGSEVLEIKGQYMTYKDDNNECWFGTIDDVIGDSREPDRNEGIHPVNLMRDDHKELLEQIISTAKISGTPGHYTLTYTQPEIPERYHFAVDLAIFKANKYGGDDYLFFKTSDGGWMKDRKYYDPSAQTVVWDLGSKVDNFDKKCVIITFEVDDMLNEDGDFGEGAAYQYILEYDGSIQRVALACVLTNGEFKDYYRYEDLPCPVFCW